MGYGDEVMRVTIGWTIHIVHENPNQKGFYDVYATGGMCHFRFFETFEDPNYLDKDKLEELVQNVLRMRTGIPE